ncbi:flagellar basal body rod protein FlgB [Marinagarivorans algicola]|uniref:flagellar basal body rod protein FlgB n=1 Tax=Marinagarivorans algicola TaxID=1513270 RepID=UPI0006B6462F|nr:flagellar basal body rod protein FlgB [Marinagarivorans algicola]
MAISFQGYTGLYESALNLRSQRSEVIAGNLANADTPNYKSRDFDFHSALHANMSSPNGGGHMRLTHQKHYQMGGGSSGAEINYRIPTQPSIDGNTVEEQVEHAEFMENTLEYQAAFTLLNSRFKGLKAAIKGE